MTETSARLSSREINNTIRYTAWSVFKRESSFGDPVTAAEEFKALIAKVAESDVQLRGFYDVSGFRADADIMLWLHAPQMEAIQSMLHEFSKTALGSALSRTWSGVALHRPAEFNKGHVPAFMTGAAPRDWVSVYPFVRSYEWYLLPEDERRDMLVEHGMMGRDYAGILSNTVAAFALGDYEWILALESNDLYEIVDMMRHLRGAKARLHVREEIPFFTGRHIELDDLGEHLR